MAVSTNPQEEHNLQQEGFKQVVVDLNKGAGGPYIYVWSHQDGCHKIKGINLLIDPKAPLEYKKAGVKVIDKNLNEGTKGWNIYIAYYSDW